MAAARVDLSLGQQVFLRELEALAEAKRDLVRDARVAVKCHQRGRRVPISAASPVPRDPPVGAETLLYCAA